MIRQVFSVSMNICGIVGVTLNVILLFCIRFSSPKELSEMRYFLANMAISDIIIAIFGALAQMIMIFRYPYIFWRPLGPVKYFDLRMSLLFICTGSCAFFHSTFSMGFGFYFRQKKVCRLVGTRSVLSRQKFFIIIAMNGLLSAVIASGPLLFRQKCDKTILDLIRKLGEDLDCNSVAPYKIETDTNLLFFKSNTANLTANWKTIGYFWDTQLLNWAFVICYVFIMYYLWRMHKFLKSQRGRMTPGDPRETDFLLQSQPVSGSFSHFHIVVANSALGNRHRVPNPPRRLLCLHGLRWHSLLARRRSHLSAVLYQNLPKCCPGKAEILEDQLLR